MNKVDQWNNIGTVVDGKMVTNTSENSSTPFSFNVDNLFEAQPNIAAAYKVFMATKEIADKTLIKHFPEVKALADDMAERWQAIYEKLGWKESNRND